MRAQLALVSVGMSVLFVLALALAPVDLREAASYATGHPIEVALALLAYTGAFVLRVASWRTMIGARVPIAKLFALLMGALFLNHAAPAKAGDLARMYALSRRGVSTAEAVMSVVLSRLVDLAGLLAVLVASLALAGSGGWDDISFPILIFAGVAAALFGLARLRLPASFGARFGVVGRYVGCARGVARDHVGETPPVFRVRGSGVGSRGGHPVRSRAGARPEALSRGGRRRDLLRGARRGRPARPRERRDLRGRDARRSADLRSTR